MSKYDLVIFDLDGTLLDTSEGLLSSVRFTIKEMKYGDLGEEALFTFIGPPVQDSFRKSYGLSTAEASKAADVFRNHYKDVDLLKAEPYEGIYETLKEIRNQDIKTAVATFKREDYALKLLEYYDFDKYLDISHGSDFEGMLKKEDIISKCIDEAEISDKSRVLMVGDTEGDLNGALKAGVAFLGVTFGFGFKKGMKSEKTKGLDLADSPLEILRFIK